MSTLKTLGQMRGKFSLIPHCNAWLVIAATGEDKAEYSWGPFDNENAAHQCVHVLAARADISSAVVVWLPPDNE